MAASSALPSFSSWRRSLLLSSIRGNRLNRLNLSSVRTTRGVLRFSSSSSSTAAESKKKRPGIYSNYWASMAYPESFREAEGVEPCLVLKRRSAKETALLIEAARKEAKACQSDSFVRCTSIVFRGESFHEDYLKHFEEHVDGLSLSLLQRLRRLRRDSLTPQGIDYALISSGPRRLPLKKRVLTTPKSPFVNKKAQEQFEHTQKAWTMTLRAYQFVDDNASSSPFQFPPRRLVDEFCSNGVSGVEISYGIEHTVDAL